MKIFYSWQSDLPNKYNRGFIENCIKRTVKKYKDTITIDADRDVQNNTGSPDIANNIFAKIDDCDLFIADISIINKSKYKIFRGSSNLKGLGYVIVRDDDYEHITITSKGWKRPVRLDSLGENYTIEAIEKRLKYNRQTMGYYVAVYHARRSPLLQLER